jgi:hypothetical protein
MMMSTPTTNEDKAKDESSSSKGVEQHQDDALKADESQEQKEEDENLDELLENMNIDEDFTLSFSEPTPETKTTEDAATNNIVTDEQPHWLRDEVYSQLYTASRAERAQVADVSARLGFHSVFRFLFCGSDADATYKSLVDDVSCVVLKKGSCDYQNNDCEIILFNVGVVVIANNLSISGSSSLLAAVAYADIEYVVATREGWRMVTTTNNKTNKTLDFKTDDASSWMDALEIILVRSTMHDKSSTMITSECGWQYRKVHRPFFTLAVTGQTDDTATEESSDTTNTTPEEAAAAATDINTTDDYHGYAPLHYAARNGHVRAVQVLLDAGADPNLPDTCNKETPVQLSSGNAELQQLLLERGGRVVVDAAQTGELFGRVAATQAIVQDKRHQQQLEQNRRQQVEETLADNRRLMALRGEQIEQMGNQADDMQQGAADMKDLARRLKEKSAQQSNKIFFGLF